MRGVMSISRSRLEIVRFLSLVVAASLALAMLVPLLATKDAKAWSVDPYLNTPICTAARSQVYPNLISDGSGGAIVVWQDSRSGNYDIFVQRLNASGTPVWMGDGLAICTAAGDQQDPVLVSDGSGGAIVVWQDSRGANYEIYAQRVNASGAPLWNTNGVAICTAGGYQASPALISDGAGGAIVVWHYSPDHYPDTCDIYAQRVSASGALLWNTNGVAICTAAYGQGYPNITSDGAGGAIIAWGDGRSGNGVVFYVLGKGDIYVQRVNASGAIQWSLNGVAVCTAVDAQEFPGLTADGSGGAFVAWTDHRSGNWDVYAQRVDSSGAPQWTDGGLAVCNAAGTQVLSTIEYDSPGVVIMGWQDGRGGDDYDVYAQKMSSSGVPQWMGNGLAICTRDGNQVVPNVVADGFGGALFAWIDSRNGNYDIYAQRVSSSGTPQWTTDGLILCCNTADQVGPPMISDGSGGAIAVWMDYRSGNYDIYAQRVNCSGRLGIRPQQPGNISPTNGTFGVSLTPILRSSAFSDPDSGDAHSASQWRIATATGDYSNPMFDRGSDGVNLTQISVPAGKLVGNTTYYWQVRHCDSHGDWSDWSAETSFTTQNLVPMQPSAASPLNGVSKVELRATLESSPFSDPDAGDVHGASQWRVTAAPGDYSSPAFDSGTDNVNLLRMTIRRGKLKGNTTYCWQVRYQDSHGDWSEWSEESSFTTRKDPQIWMWIVLAGATVAIPAGGIGIWRLRSAKKHGSTQG